jgi:hypothetical protein
MACSCANKKNASGLWTVTKPDGTKSTYRTEIEARAAAVRVGGTFRAN